MLLTGKVREPCHPWVAPNTRSDQHLDGWLPSRGEAAISPAMQVYHLQITKPIQFIHYAEHDHQGDRDRAPAPPAPHRHRLDVRGGGAVRRARYHGEISQYPDG